MAQVPDRSAAVGSLASCSGLVGPPRPEARFKTNGPTAADRSGIGAAGMRTLQLTLALAVRARTTRSEANAPVR